jgi:hypothetical protein
MKRALPLVLLTSLLIWSCTGQVSMPPVETTPPPPPPPPEKTLADVPVDDVKLVLSLALPSLVGRVPTNEERDRLDSEGSSAMLPILESALAEPTFAQSARTLIERKLSVSGVRDDVDFGLPGNLAAHIVKNGLPWSQILTADSCYDRDDNAIACDTGAPYAAGVLTTRGYMISRAGRFNLTRSSTLMRAFACQGYPQDYALEPLLPKEKLIPLFRAETFEEVTDPRAAGGFGNGEGCYFCHGQFGAHAQLFVKFDVNGIYRPEATGEQDPVGELGRSYDGLLASHFNDPAERALENSQMFGQPVANIVEAAQVFTQNPVFTTCAVRNVMEHALMVDPSVDVDPRLLTRIADRARARHADPTLADLVVATLTDPLVIDSITTSLRGAP